MADHGNAAGLVCHQVLGVAQPFQRHHPGPATLAAAGASRRQPFVHALADQVAFHLGERRLNLQKGPAGGSRGVERGVKGAKTNAPALELVDKPDQLAGTPPKPIEIQDDENIAVPEIIETGRKTRAVRTRATGVVLENPIATGDLEGVHLPIKDLPFLSGRDACVTYNRHNLPSSLPKTFHGKGFSSIDFSKIFGWVPVHLA